MVITRFYVGNGGCGVARLPLLLFYSTTNNEGKGRESIISDRRRCGWGESQKIVGKMGSWQLWFIMVRTHRVWVFLQEREKEDILTERERESGRESTF